MQRLNVAVLGAGGLVAQRLQQRLGNHPWFELAAVAGSPRYLGMALDDVPWVLDDERPSLPPLNVVDVSSPNDVEALAKEGVCVAFSALPSEEARRLEPMWVEAGITVFSNASAFRRQEGVPFVIPEINPHALVEQSAGPLRHACATNCTLLPLILPLAALNEAYGLEGYTMRSEQGLSGGGQAYMEAALAEGTVKPTIPGEAEKTEAELRHLLGWHGEATLDCGRTMRRDGHHVFVEATFAGSMDEAGVEQVLSAWSHDHRMSHLPSAPHQPLMLAPTIDVKAHLFADGNGFPQSPNPATERAAGMAVVVANLRCPRPNTVSFEAFSHNTIRGAAGGVVLLAELAHSMELL